METKGITCKIPLELHQQIKEEQERLGVTMNQYMEMVLREHFTPKGEVNMGKTRTLAFQVSEELFEKVKDYLARYEQAYGRRLTQKEFVIGLIESALEEAEDDSPEETGATWQPYGWMANIQSIKDRHKSPAEMRKPQPCRAFCFHERGDAFACIKDAGGFGGKTGLYAVGLPIKEATQQGYKIAYPGDSVNFAYAQRNTRRGRVGRQIAHTLTTDASQGVVEWSGRIRRLTPRECLRLQGWKDDRIDRVLAIQLDT